MKSVKIYVVGLIGLFSIGLLSSCEKTFDEKIDLQSDFSNSSLVQVYLATVNASRNYVYVDNKAVNGAPLVTGSIFPSTGPGFVMTPGFRAFLIKDTLSAATQAPVSFAVNTQAAKFYTIFMYDTINAAKQKTVTTDIVVPSDTTARIRFANFIYNPAAIPNIDVFSYTKNANIFTNVAVTDVTPFITYPSGVVTDTLYIRETGTSVNIIKLPLTLTQKRNYTFLYRGSHRGTRIGTLFLNY